MEQKGFVTMFIKKLKKIICEIVDYKRYINLIFFYIIDVLELDWNCCY